MVNGCCLGLTLPGEHCELWADGRRKLGWRCTTRACSEGSGNRREEARVAVARGGPVHGVRIHCRWRLALHLGLKLCRFGLLHFELGLLVLQEVCWGTPRHWLLLRLRVKGLCLLRVLWLMNMRDGASTTIQRIVDRCHGLLGG